LRRFTPQTGLSAPIKTPCTPKAGVWGFAPNSENKNAEAFLFRSYPLREPKPQSGFGFAEFREAKLQEPLLEFGALPQTPKTKTLCVLVPLARFGGLYASVRLRETPRSSVVIFLTPPWFVCFRGDNL
jgi:hypothetical protein